MKVLVVLSLLMTTAAFASAPTAFTPRSSQTELGDPGQNPGQDPGQNPGQDPGQNPGQDPGQNPGQE